MGKCRLHASLFIFDQIIIKVAGNHDRHKQLGQVRFRASGFDGPFIIMFYEMRFDHGTLDSGERLLPFGLLVGWTLRLLPYFMRAKSEGSGETGWKL